MNKSFILYIVDEYIKLYILSGNKCSFHGQYDLSNYKLLTRLCMLLEKRVRNKIFVYIDVSYIYLEQNIFDKNVSTKDVKKIINLMYQKPDYIIFGAMKLISNLQNLSSKARSISANTISNIGVIHKYIFLHLSKADTPEGLRAILDFLSNCSNEVCFTTFMPLCILQSKYAQNIGIYINVRLYESNRVSIVASYSRNFVIWREDVLSDGNKVATMINDTMQYTKSLVTHNNKVCIDIMHNKKDGEFISSISRQLTSNNVIRILRNEDIVPQNIKIDSYSDNVLDDAIVASVIGIKKNTVLFYNKPLRIKHIFIKMRKRLRLFTASLFLLILMMQCYDVLFAIPQLTSQSKEAWQRLSGIQNELSSLKYPVQPETRISMSIDAIMSLYNERTNHPTIDSIMNPIINFVNNRVDIDISTYHWQYIDNQILFDTTFVLSSKSGYIEDIRQTYAALSTFLKQEYGGTLQNIDPLLMNTAKDLIVTINVSIVKDV